MTDITRVFDYRTRAIRNVDRRYSGQIFDANATTIHFEYDPINFLAHSDDEEYWIPYIMFSVQDDDKNFLVYGPDPNTSQPTFDGYTFTIPWDVTSRVAKSRRVDYQLWFVKNTVEFDPDDGVAHLQPGTQYILSEIDCIVIKPSIECRKKPPFCPATAPSSEPSVVGYINLWKDYGVVMPVSKTVAPDLLPDGTPNPDAGKTILEFKTYNGDKNMKLVLDLAPLEPFTDPETGVTKEAVPIQYLPTGHTAGTIPLIVSEIKNGRTLVYSETLGGFVDSASITPEGSVTSEQLDEMERTGLDMQGEPLIPGVIYNCTDPHEYAGEVYRAGTNWIWEPVTDPDTDDYVTDPDTGAVLYHWEPLTGGEDLSAYQLQEFRTSDWAQEDPDGEYYPSLRLVKEKASEIETRLETDEADITELQGRMDDAEANVQDIFSQISDEPDGINARIRRNTEAIEGLQDDVTDVNNRVATVEGDLSGVKTRVTTLETVTEEQGRSITTLQGDVTSLGETKLNKTEVLRTAAQPTSETNVYSANVMQTLLGDKTDKTQAIPVWDSQAQYRLNSTVLYSDSIYISNMDNNTNHEPSDETWWTQISGGSGGGSSGGSSIRHKTIQFGDDSNTEYTLFHNLGTYDFLYSLRTNDAERHYIFADVYAATTISATVKVSEPPGENGLILNVIEAGGFTPGGTSVTTETITTPATTWTYNNSFGKPVFVQMYENTAEDVPYDQIWGEVSEPFPVLDTDPAFTPVTITFTDQQAHSGELVVVRSDLVFEFAEPQNTWIIDHNFSEFMAVQCYTREYGIVQGKITQNGNTVVVQFDQGAVSGYAVLMEPRRVEPIQGGSPGVHTVGIHHNLNRFVAVQVYDGAWGEVKVDVHQNGIDYVEISWDESEYPQLMGRALII